MASERATSALLLAIVDDDEAASRRLLVASPWLPKPPASAPGHPAGPSPGLRRPDPHVYRATRLRSRRGRRVSTGYRAPPESHGAECGRATVAAPARTTRPRRSWLVRREPGGAGGDVACSSGRSIIDRSTQRVAPLSRLRTPRAAAVRRCSRMAPTRAAEQERLDCLCNSNADTGEVQGLPRRRRIRPRCAPPRSHVLHRLRLTSGCWPGHPPPRPEAAVARRARDPGAALLRTLHCASGSP